MRAEILTSVFTRLRPALLASAKSVLRDSADDAPDALQEAFCRLWRHRDRLETEEHACAASYTAVRNAAIDMVRRSRPTVTDEMIPDAIAELYDEVSRIIRQALSERERDVLMLRDHSGFELDAIASRFGTTEANVRVILSRARRKVRECYRNRNKNI